ncbi:hypothetical protein [Pseudomonas sp. zjy_14]|uniref:hypothetical protein n=1 Tax=Pseudomonas sp. zjy_14 TaxID=3367264 RepID=UPI00370A4709
MNEVSNNLSLLLDKVTRHTSQHLSPFFIQFRDIRPKAVSEINDLSEASVLPGHSKEGDRKALERLKFQNSTPKVSELVAFFVPQRKTPQTLICGAFEWWRPRSESNRRRRICNPPCISLHFSSLRAFQFRIEAFLATLQPFKIKGHGRSCGTDFRAWSAVFKTVA